MVPLGLPGLWVMMLGVLSYGWFTDFQTVGLWTTRYLDGSILRKNGVTPAPGVSFLPGTSLDGLARVLQGLRSERLLLIADSR
jgi:hypothetical protein